MTPPQAWATGPPAGPSGAAGGVSITGGGVDAALAAAAAGTGPQAEQAMRLLTLQVLSRLGDGRGRREEAADFEDYACRLLGGGGDQTGGGGGDVGPDAGARGGCTQLHRIQLAIKKDPRAWTLYFNGLLRRQLGAEELGTGWSAAEYGPRKIEWGKLNDLEHAFFLLAEIHRLLHAQNFDMAEAFFAARA